MTSGGDKDEETLPFFMDYLPEFALRKAEENLKETKDNRVEGLAKLKTLIEGNESISGIKFHDDFLYQILRRRKYDIEKSFTQLQNYVNLRKKHSNLFKSVSTEDLLTKESYKYITVLPKRCPEGCTIVHTQAGKFNPDEMPFEDYERVGIMLFQQPLRDPMTQINGYKIIHDFKGTSIKHAQFCTPRNVTLMYHISMECLPAPYKEIHIINQSVLLRILWAVTKNFLSSKMRKRIFFHSSTDELFNYFPRSVIPSIYGGDLKDYYMSDYVKDINKQFGECTVEGQPNYF